ncbi:hypothetical protein [Streptomyces sp. NPDC001480]|uniref:hypothetical protein n=1 Tax=Streptomyces sp. NPDC001480 TaxID=3364577 RepID=UPI00368F24B4
MATERERAALIGYLIFAIPVAAIGFWIANTGPTTAPPDYTTPSEPALVGTPSPAESIPETLEPAEQDCGDGTRGTFAECWARGIEEALQDLKASRSAAARRWTTSTALPTPIASFSYQPPTVTVCSDGSISHSTGRGTCSWHGGISH